PVAAPLRPEQREPTPPLREREPGGAEDAVRRTVGPRLVARRAGDDVERAVEVVREAAGRTSEEQRVPVAVQGDLVAGGCDLGRERWIALDLLADEEECRARVRGPQQLERRRRALRMRPVVERQCDPRARPAQRDAER